MIVRLIVVVLGVLCIAVAGAGAQTIISFDTPVGNAAWNGIVNRDMAFSIVGDATNVALANRGTDFALSTVQTSRGLSWSPARETVLFKSGGFTGGGIAGSDWGLTRNFSGALQLTALRFEGTDTLMIGPLRGDALAGASGPIVRFKLRDTFIDQVATFSLKVPCLGNSETERRHPFVFHAKKEHGDHDWDDDDDDDDDDGGGGVVVPGSPAVTPEPTTMLLLGSGLAVMLGAVSRRKAASAA